MSTRVLTLRGEHSSHTRDENGNFKHPFSEGDHEIVHYPDSKTFSVKLNKKSTDKHKHGRPFSPKKSNQRAFTNNPQTVSPWFSSWSDLRNYFTGGVLTTT